MQFSCRPNTQSQRVTGNLRVFAKGNDSAACLLDDDRPATGSLAVITFRPIDCAKAPGCNLLGDLEVILQMDAVIADVQLTVDFGAVNTTVHCFSKAEVLWCLRWSNVAAELLLTGCMVKLCRRIAAALQKSARQQGHEVA